MKKLLFGIALILFAVFLVLLDQGFLMPGFTQGVYLVSAGAGLLFAFIGFLEKG